MKVTVFIRIMGKINSRELYEIISQFEMNVTDCGDYTLVYGECRLETAERVFYHCSRCGNLMAELTHGR